MRIFFMMSMAVILVTNVWSYDLEEGQKNWDIWAACSADLQCVPIHDECYGWTTVNIKYKAEGEEYKNALAAAVKCLEPKLEPDPKVLCLQQVCSIKPAMLDSGSMANE